MRINIKNIIKYPLLYLDKAGIIRLNDETYLKMLFKQRTGENLDLNNPKTFNQKLQWLKLYNRNDFYTTLVDKYEVKKFIEKKLGKQYVIPLLGVYDNFDEIDFEKLPNEFVIKCTHDSEGLVIVNDKSKMNYKEARKKTNKCLKRNFYYAGREWPYKNVKPRIIIEEYMVDESGYELKDYKFFCFNGKVEYMFIASDRTVVGEETKFDFFDVNFNHLDLKHGHPNSKKEVKKPNSFDKMIEFAEILSKDIPHVRIDFYEINGQVYFGEMTFFHHSGLVPFVPPKWDLIWGELIDLNLVKKNDK